MEEKIKENRLKIEQQLTKELAISIERVQAVMNLIEEGSTIPFIARYRKEATGGMDDALLRTFHERLVYLQGLEERKSEVIGRIESLEQLTPSLRKSIEMATTLQQVEDLYRPFKQKKQTRATKAKEKGLTPLALWLLAKNTGEKTPLEKAEEFICKEKNVLNVEEALQGARDIIAEQISDSPAFRTWIRSQVYKRGQLVSVAVNSEEETVYESYYEYKESLKTLPSHRILAINRGEKEGFLRVKVQMPDEDLCQRIQEKMAANRPSLCKEQIEKAVEDGYKRLLAPSVEREIRTALTEKAQEEAISVFGKNTRPLLLMAPVPDKVVLAIDPGYRTGCKIAVLDKTGRFVASETIYPHKPQSHYEKAKTVLINWIKTYKVDVVAIGNGTASRETEGLVSDCLKAFDKKVSYAIVSEAGASVYSASALATKEYPDVDVSIRGAISIGRRLQDPLAELVKIDPKHIGVGQYQHDLNQKRLSESLAGVVESCVNTVGVDLNTATPSLLCYVSGISASVAKNIVAFRDENGKYVSRNNLKKVPRLGPKAYEQCAGFLRISGGNNPLDNTAVHPESYSVAQALVKELGYEADALNKGALFDIEKRVKDWLPEGQKQQMDLSFTQEKRYKALAETLKVGVPTLKDIVEEIKKPGRDPRKEGEGPVFRSDVLGFDDLQVGMVLTGTVRNVVDFGAFVDVGVKNDGLVHISELSDRYVKNAMDVVQVGDRVQVTVLSMDKDRQKLSLSMKTGQM